MKLYGVNNNVNFNPFLGLLTGLFPFDFGSKFLTYVPSLPDVPNASPISHSYSLNHVNSDAIDLASLNILADNAPVDHELNYLIPCLSTITHKK